METIWNENELIYQENDEMIANLGFRHFSPSSLYVIERVWVKDDQSLKIKLIQDFIQHFFGLKPLNFSTTILNLIHI